MTLKKSIWITLKNNTLALTALIFNAGLAACPRLSFSSLFLFPVDNETLLKPALNMSAKRCAQLKENETAGQRLN